MFKSSGSTGGGGDAKTHDLHINKQTDNLIEVDGGN